MRPRQNVGILAVGLACGTAATLAAPRAHAQQATFHLDRLEIPGGPDDGLVLFRPVTQQAPTFFAQLGLGYSLDPLLTKTVTSDAPTIHASSRGVVKDQLTQYATVGFEFLDRFVVSATLPVTWFQDGQNPDYSTGIFNGLTSTTFDTSGVAVGDTRLDLRGVIARSWDRKVILGGQLSVFAPSGTNANFGGDGSTSAMLMVTGEYTYKVVTFVANTGLAFRPVNSINDPANSNGLAVGNEWRWAVGAFIPLRDGKYRLGASIFGQTGIDGSKGNTFFRVENTPVEWNVEGRMKLGPRDHWWVGGGAGTRLSDGYGAPDLRVVALFGAYFPIGDVDAPSPTQAREKRRENRQKDLELHDADHDGIPDDIDACPTEPEDHLGSDPNDGCPQPPDRDGDGIPDITDKCPDVPEDKDGIQDADGCPEDDADHDGIPDTKDACPRVPGQPSPDPKKNGCPQFIKLEGSTVRILQQVHFAYNSATILPDSFPMLQEIANLLKANPQIARMAIEGHTDDRGPDDYNLHLSQARASSVMVWLTQHGVESGRLEAHGYGEARPIADNATEEGRTANRRVEFKIVQEDVPGKVQPKATAPPEPPAKPAVEL
jgi:outer membrane protein OmpA-like peptidoglycan-associated protein